MAFGGNPLLTILTENYLRNAEEDRNRDLVRAVLGNDHYSRNDNHYSRNDNTTVESLLRAVGSCSSRDRNSYRSHDESKEDSERRTNATAQIANSAINPGMLHAEIQPKLQSCGSFPRDFEKPKRVEEFLHMDNTTLDRLLQCYNLPRDGAGNSCCHSMNRGGYGMSPLAGNPALLQLLGSGMNSQLARRAALMNMNPLAMAPLLGHGGFGMGGDPQRDTNLRTLFEFLGVDMKDERGLGAGMGALFGAGGGGYMGRGYDPSMPAGPRGYVGFGGRIPY